MRGRYCFAIERSKAYRGLWFGGPFDAADGPESIEGLTIPSKVEGQTGESKG